jgi:hypothetical protein
VSTNKRDRAPRAWLAAAALLVGAAAFGAAPKMCIPNVAGVPGSSGPPDWYTAGQLTPTNRPFRAAYQPADPRWAGAMSLDYGSGSVSEVEYRALYSQTGAQQYVLLSWNIKSIAQFQVDNTALYAGFYSPGANTGALLKVTLKNTFTGAEPQEPGPNPGDPPFDFFPPNTPVARHTDETAGGIAYFEAALTTGAGADPAAWTTPAAPAWLAGANGTLRAWVNAQTNPYKWTVQLRVPIAAAVADGINLDPASFRMWNYAQVAVLLSGSSPPAIVPYTWPRPESGQPALQYASYLQGINQVFPAATTWGEFALVSNPAADATCSGVYLTSNRIGTRSTPYNSHIKLDAANTFFAEPENKGAAIGANIMSATWRVANWGSQVGDVGANSWSAPAALTNVAGGAIGANAFGNIEAQWNPSSNLNDLCPFVGQSGVNTPTGNVPGNAACPNATPTRMLHQCVLVKLNGPGLNFVRDSATRNMDFVKASTVEREAEISVSGLPDLAAGKRDVFMYVELRNMPRHPQPEGEMPIPNPGGDDPGNDGPNDGPNDNPNFDLRRGLAAGKLPYSDEQLAQLLPTWIVHNYHDTGERIKLASGEFVVLAPQGAFGHFVTHEGAFTGWADVIEGADRLREDLYKVSPPNDGAVRVKTIIQAVEAGEAPVGQWPPKEPGTGGSGLPWWVWLLIVLAIIVLFLIFRRRPAGP